MKHSIRITAVALLFVSAASMSVLNVSGQEATPTPSSVSEAEAGGFFSDFRIGDAISLASIVGVGILGFWLFRIQGARMQLLDQSVQSAKDELDDERKRCQEESERERRHTQRLREQHE
ncbi:MAG: hypothetical protein IIB21_05970, partial [Chloroflexi bacterium]|nr:hypothetical protein [Chloroflexota bacterium]